MYPLITSLQNLKIKSLVSLTQQRKRKEKGIFCIEGIQELTLARTAGYTIKEVFFCPDIIPKNELQAIIGDTTQNIVPVTKTIFEKIAYRKTTGGIVALALPLETSLDELPLPKKPLILVLQGIEKPGNLGALLRTADAAGVDAVIVCDEATDLYNPNVIRSSLGCLFTNRIVSTDSTTAMQWLYNHGIHTYAASLQGKTPYRAVDYTLPCAILMGSEHNGLSQPIQEQVREKIIIPMRGKIDSINVSVAAGILLFEALRQRS